MRLLTWYKSSGTYAPTVVKGIAGAAVAGSAVVAAEFSWPAARGWLARGSIAVGENSNYATGLFLLFFGVLGFSTAFYGVEIANSTPCFPKGWRKALCRTDETQYQPLFESGRNIEPRGLVQFLKRNSTPIAVASLLTLFTEAGIGLSAVFGDAREAYRRFCEYLLGGNFSPQVNQTLSLMLGNSTAVGATPSTGSLAIAPITAALLALMLIALFASLIRKFCLCWPSWHREYSLEYPGFSSSEGRIFTVQGETTRLTEQENPDASRLRNPDGDDHTTGSDNEPPSNTF